jgi:hypothetical protein
MGQPGQQARVVGIAPRSALHAVLGEFGLHRIPQRQVDDGLMLDGIDVPLVAAFAATDPVCSMCNSAPCEGR